MSLIRDSAFVAIIYVALIGGASAQVGRDKGKDIVVPDRNTSKSVITDRVAPKPGKSSAGTNSDGSLYYGDTKRK
jgi:hypothetical protein